MRSAAADGAAGSVVGGIAVIAASGQSYSPHFSPALVDSNISTLSWIERCGDSNPLAATMLADLGHDLTKITSLQSDLIQLDHRTLVSVSKTELRHVD